MQEDRWLRVGELFSAALRRSADAREAFLRECCGDDEELRETVASLIVAHGHAGDFLSTPALGPASSIPDLEAERDEHWLIGDDTQIKTGNDNDCSDEESWAACPTGA